MIVCIAKQLTRGWRSWVLAALVLLAAVLLVNSIALAFAPRLHTLNVGFRADRHYLHGFFDQEEDVNGVRYRWSGNQSRVHFPQLVRAQQGTLTLVVGGVPDPAVAPRGVQLALDGQPWLLLPVAADARAYTLLLPPTALHDGALQLDMSGSTSRIPPDRRDVGIRLDAVTVGWLPSGVLLPTWAAVAAQWTTLAVVAVVGMHLGLAWRWVLGGVAGALAVLVGMTVFDPLVGAMWQLRLALASVATLLVVWLVCPRLARLLPQWDDDPAGARTELRGLVLLTLGAVAVRMLAVLYPVFDSHDWYIHEERLGLFRHGALLLFDKPAEFGTRQAIVPPAFYLLAAPFTLFTHDTVPANHAVFAFLDGWSVLALGILVRQLGGGVWAARLALLLLALLPIQFTALWWGFGPQVVGQALWLGLAVFIAHRANRGSVGVPLWAGVLVLFLVLALVHNGVLLLAGFGVAGYVALGVLAGRQQWQPRAVLPWTGLVALSALLAFGLLYADVVALQLRGVANNDRLAFTAEDFFRVKYTLGSLCASFRPLAVAPCDQFLVGNDPATVLPQLGVTVLSSLLVIAALVAVVWTARGAVRGLVLAWLGSSGLFFVVDLLSGLQVRYAYFVVPLVCAGVALLLERAVRRHPAGWLLAAVVLGGVAWAGLHLWYEGVFLAIKPSLRPLTH